MRNKKKSTAEAVKGSGVGSSQIERRVHRKFSEFLGFFACIREMYQRISYKISTVSSVSETQQAHYHNSVVNDKYYLISLLAINV